LISNFFNFLNEWAFLNSDELSHNQLKRKNVLNEFFFSFDDPRFSFFDKFFFSIYKSLLPKDFFFFDEFHKIRKRSIDKVHLDKKVRNSLFQVNHFFRTSNKSFLFLKKLHNLKLDLQLIKKRYFFAKKIDFNFLNKLNKDLKFLSKIELLFSSYIKKAHYRERDFIVHDYQYYDNLFSVQKS
jgi:hypothetical protein